LNLYVDDIRKCPPDFELARTNTKAIRLLSTQEIGILSVDHDMCICKIGEKPFRAEILDETYRPVIYYVCLMPKERRPRKIILHSANYYGRQAMFQILTESGAYLPEEITIAPASYILTSEELEEVKQDILEGA
jgi:NAD+-processing family protein with receiver domain